MTAVVPAHFVDFEIHVRDLDHKPSAPSAPGAVSPAEGAFEFPEPPGGATYAVHARSSLGSDVSGVTRLDPAADWVLEAVAMLASGRLPEDQLRRWGTRLLVGDPANDIHGLLEGPVRAELDRCLGVAIGSNRGLQVRLKIEPPEVAALPWEYMFDPHDRIFWSTDSRILLCRSVSDATSTPPARAQLPLRGLLVATGAGGIDTTAEAAFLTGSSTPTRDLVRWDVLSHPVRGDDLLERLRTRRYHILHFSGHGVFERDNKLFLDDGGAELSAADFAALVQQQRHSLRLVVLNACRSGQVPVGTEFGGVAWRLLRLGVPAVVAMQRPVSDTDAMRFSRVLYTTLHRPAKGNVAVAVNLARLALRLPAEGGRRRASHRGRAGEPDRAGTDVSPDLEDVPGATGTAFGIPVLYLRSRDPRLFDLRDAFAVRLRRHLVLWIAIIACAMGARALGWTDGLDDRRHAKMMQALEQMAGPFTNRTGTATGSDAPRRLGPPGTGSAPRVVVVDLTEEWARWPWLRRDLADLVQILLEDLRVTLVVLDLTLDSRPLACERTSFAEANARLARLARDPETGRPRVVFAVDGTLDCRDRRICLFDVETKTPEAVMHAKPVRGFAAFVTRNGQVRQVPREVVAGTEGGVRKKLQPLAVAAAACVRPALVASLFRATGGVDMLEWPYVAEGRWAGERRIDASKLLADLHAPGDARTSRVGAWRRMLENAVAVVGQYADAPLEERYQTLWAERRGVALQAGLLETLLQGRLTYRDRERSFWIQIGAWAVLGLVMLFVRRPFLRCGATVLGLLVLIVAETVSLQTGRWLDTPVPEFEYLALAFGAIGVHPLLGRLAAGAWRGLRGGERRNPFG